MCWSEDGGQDLYELCMQEMRKVVLLGWCGGTWTEGSIVGVG